MATIEEMVVSQKAKGLATILAIGTANPNNQMLQKDFPDFYFRVTNWDANSSPHLKDKFKRICEKTRIRKRHMFITEEFLKEHPNMVDYDASSLDIRQDILPIEVPKLANRPKRHSRVGVIMPGYDVQLAKLLDLGPHIQRFMLYQQGCNAGGTALRLAKDTDIDSMVGQALFTDGAAAVIIGADPNRFLGERPLFELLSASQSIVPDTEFSIRGQLRQVGLAFTLSRDNATVIAKNIDEPLVKAFSPLGINDWNSIFWVVHPGGPAILDQIEAKLGLDKDKLWSSRHVLNEFGNMSSPTMLFVLDETRKRSIQEGKGSTGEGLEYGVLMGLGPGITIETIVLRSTPI